MDDRFQYLLLMAGCLIITLPLEFGLRARVYRRPRRLLLSLLPVLAIFLVWDVVGIVRRHWWYSESYTTGIRFPFESRSFGGIERGHRGRRQRLVDRCDAPHQLVTRLARTCHLQLAKRTS